MSTSPINEIASIRKIREIFISGMFLMATSYVAAESLQEKDVKTGAAECSPDSAIRSQPTKEVSIVTAEQLLLKLREIHENFLLLDRAFITEKNLKTTFGLAKRYNRPLDIPEDLFFRIQPARSGLLQTDLHFSTSVLHRDKPRSRHSDIYATPDQDSNFYPADLVERTVAKDILGRDLVREAALGLSDASVSHARENYILRGPALHPKGYLKYREIKEDECARSSLNVRLNESGEVFSIRITQEEK